MPPNEQIPADTCLTVENATCVDPHQMDNSSSQTHDSERFVPTQNLVPKGVSVRVRPPVPPLLKRLT
jgi:hypothetical protein